MKNIFKIILISAAFIFSTVMINVFEPIEVYAEETTTIDEETEEIFVIEKCTPQSTSYTLTAKETNTIEYTVTYDKLLPDDFTETTKYQASKIQLSDFTSQATDNEGDGSCSFENITVLSINGRVCVYQIRIKAGPKAGSTAIICAKADGVVKIKIDKEATFIDTISKILSTSTILTLIITLAVTIVGKASIKIFRFGVNYKSTFATVEQQEKFEASIREELRVNKTEMQDNILKICLREITRETRPLRDIQTLANGLQTDREILNVRLDSIDQKYNEMRKLSDNVNQLEQKVNRLQYSDGTSDIRRSGK